MATGGHGETSDEVFDFACSPCAEQNKNREAVRYCVECQDYYCQSCTDMHKMFPAMRGHKLLNKADFSSSEQESSLPQVPTERCYVHKTKLIDMYCGNHDDVCCTSCVAEHHRSCESVTSITDIIKKRKTAGGECNTLIQSLSSLINVCVEMQDKAEENISEIDVTKKKALDGIKSQRKELDTLLDTLENASKREVENEHKNLTDEYAEVKQRARKYENILQKRIAALQSSGSNRAQQFVSEKLGLKDHKEISGLVNSNQKENLKTFEFIGETNLHHVLSEMTTLGHVRRHEKYLIDTRNSLYKIKRTHELNVRISNDKQSCTITSCCFDDKGYLLLVDNTNTFLKRVDIETQTVKDHCLMPGKPIAVCSVNKNEAAVSMYNNSIQFVSLGDRLKLRQIVKLDHTCWGLACSEERMFITDGGMKLYIHDLSGKLIKTIEYDNVDIFTDNMHITLDRFTNKVFVADNYKGLVSFDMNGKYISSFINQKLNVAHGVCSDGKGNIFVGARGDGNVIQIGADGQMRGEVINSSHGLYSIWSVCFDQVQKRLVVTTSCIDKVYIFDLE